MVPTRNRAALLAEALKSVRALEGPDLTVELIVVDDGSTDDTAAIAACFADRVLVAGGVGSAAARNTGLAAAAGEFVALLDDDDVYTPGQARPHIQLMRERPELQAVVGQIVNIGEDLTGPTAPWPQTLPLDGDLFASFFRYYPQVGGTVVRRSALASVGESDTTLWGDQDWDWHLRLALAHPMGFVPVPSVLFRQRPASVRGEDLEWRRLGYMYRVLWRNARRGRKAGRGPSLTFLLRALLHHQGAYSGYFGSCAAEHATRGKRRRALRAIGRAFLASPIHATAGALRRRPMRSALAALVRSRRPRRDDREAPQSVAPRPPAG